MLGSLFRQITEFIINKTLYEHLQTLQICTQVYHGYPITNRVYNTICTKNSHRNTIVNESSRQVCPTIGTGRF